MAAVIRRALELVRPHSPESGRLLSRHGRILGITDGDHAGAVDAFERSIAIARGVGDLATEARALGAALCVDFFHLEHAAAMEKGPRALAISRELGDLDAEAAAAYWYASSVRSVGRTDHFESTVRAMLATAEKLRNRFWLAGAIWLDENAARFRGDWVAARRVSDRGLALSPLDIRLLATRALLEFECGAEGAANGYVERLLDLTAGVTHGTRPEHALTAATVLIGAALSGASSAREIAAEREARAVVEAPTRAPALRLTAAIGLAMIGVARRDADAVCRLLPLVLAHRGTYALPGGQSCDRIAGTVAGVMGNHDAAVRHCADAVAFCRLGRNRPELAWSLHDHARALIERDGRGDRKAANTAAAEALQLSREIGMSVLATRIDAVQRGIPPKG